MILQHRHLNLKYLPRVKKDKLYPNSLILDTDSGTGESPIRAAVEVHSEGYESEHSNSNSNSNGNSNSNRNSNSNSEPEELADEVMYDPSTIFAL